jgi:hypothetical protein
LAALHHVLELLFVVELKLLALVLRATLLQWRRPAVLNLRR